MTDQQQRTQWALDLFRAFVKAWTPPAARSQILNDNSVRKVNLDADICDGEKIIAAIQAIAPKDDGKAHVGWAVFKRTHDTDYDRERPSGWVHTQVGAVFETMKQVGNVHQSCVRKDPDGHYLICEIREIP